MVCGRNLQLDGVTITTVLLSQKCGEDGARVVPGLQTASSQSVSGRFVPSVVRLFGWSPVHLSADAFVRLTDLESFVVVMYSCGSCSLSVEVAAQFARIYVRTYSHCLNRRKFVRSLKQSHTSPNFSRCSITHNCVPELLFPPCNRSPRWSVHCRARRRRQRTACLARQTATQTHRQTVNTNEHKHEQGRAQHSSRKSLVVGRWPSKTFVRLCDFCEV